MSRRQRHEEEFGSDAFLDVLANMVGILIILIVIAGVRAARGPVATAAEGAPTADAPADPVPVAQAALPPDPDSDEPPAEWNRELAAINADLESLRTEKSAGNSAIERVHSEYTTARKSAAGIQKAATQSRQSLEGQKSNLARLEQDLGSRKDELTALLAEFEDAKHARGPVTKVRHRLAPISQEVEGEEFHFRLAQNRVSVIPLTQLVERVKFQIERQKDWLARHTRNQGTVGPVDGYTLVYTVERLSLSPIEERKLGYGAFRVGVSKWELVVAPDVPAETEDEALRRGSRFAAALQTAPEHAALTFWVYPDSFGLFRSLQEAAHAEGFVVSGRPLPEGASIAASPHGSKSAGQ